jgi:hypothetical protein
MFLESLMMTGPRKRRTAIIEKNEGITSSPIKKYEVMNAATEKATPSP